MLWAAEADQSQTGTLPPDVVWCNRCGGYSSTKLYKLGSVCSGVLQRAAQDRLSWLNRGRHPVTKHLLAPPVRLTDAVVRALGEGAARRRAAFNTLLRGGPHEDGRGRGGLAQHEGQQLGDSHRPGPNPADDETQDADKMYYDHSPMLDDDFDYDVFGHGGQLHEGSDAHGVGGGADAKRRKVAEPQDKDGEDGDGEGRRQTALGDARCMMPGSSTDRPADMTNANGTWDVGGGSGGHDGTGGTADAAGRMEKRLNDAAQEHSHDAAHETGDARECKRMRVGMRLSDRGELSRDAQPAHARITARRSRDDDGVCHHRCEGVQGFKRRRIRGKQPVPRAAGPIVTPGASASTHPTVVDQPRMSDAQRECL